eukprot:2572990-Amphidinium_carterae.3
MKRTPGSSLEWMGFCLAGYTRLRWTTLIGWRFPVFLRSLADAVHQGLHHALEISARFRLDFGVCPSKVLTLRNSSCF